MQAYEAEPLIDQDGVIQIRKTSKFGGEREITKSNALKWARWKMHAMTMGDDKYRLAQVNKFLQGIQYTIKDLKNE